MSKLDPIDEFVREQLASGRFSDYDALVRHALVNLMDRQSEIAQIDKCFKRPLDDFELLPRSNSFG